MPFTLDAFERVRPYLFHLTSSRNLARIRRLRQLHSASSILTSAGRPEAARERRRGHLSVNVAGEEVVIRDQDPLHRGNVTLHNGWSFEDLIESLNQRIFFWPGSADGPIAYGMRHFERYEAERPAVIRTSLQDLRNSNADLNPFFCKYNSGAPRCTQGRGSPRGENTFISAQNAPFTPGAVVEVVFNSELSLGDTTKYSASLNGPWHSL
jgi:hypothetical protein